MKVITIGREPSNNIVISDTTVSRTHCQIIQHDNGTFSIADFGSKNGTFVNGHRIQGEMPLQYGDTVTVGRTPVQWQGYFGGSMHSAGGYQSPSQGGSQTTNSSTGMIVGIVVGLAVCAVVAVLAFSGVFSSKETATPRPDNSGVVTNVPGVRPDRPGNTNAAANGKDTVKLVKEPIEKEVDANFSGNWEWESPTSTNFGGEIVPCMTFQIDLKQNGNKLKGSYNSMDVGMGMMDYDDEPGGNPVSGTVSGNKVTVKLVSTARGGSATGTLTYKNANTIEWRIGSVKGDVFGVIVPDKATLHRRKK